MKYLNKLSRNETEAEIQNYYHNLGYQSIRRGWPDFVFWKKGKDNKKEYLFIEVKKPIVSGSPFARKRRNRLITPPQRKMKNIFLDLGLDHRVCFGLLPDGTPNFKIYAGINKNTKK